MNGLLLPPELIREGACATPDVDPEWFSPDASPADVRKAQHVCSGCAVKTLCCTWAIEHDQWGCWGGELLRHHKSLGDPDVRETAHALFADGYGYRRVAELLDISLQSAISFHSAWRRQQRKPA